MPIIPLARSTLYPRPSPKGSGDPPPKPQPLTLPRPAKTRLKETQMKKVFSAEFFSHSQHKAASSLKQDQGLGFKFQSHYPAHSYNNISLKACWCFVVLLNIVLVLIARLKHGFLISTINISLLCRGSITQSLQKLFYRSTAHSQVDLTNRNPKWPLFIKRKMIRPLFFCTEYVSISSNNHFICNIYVLSVK